MGRPKKNYIIFLVEGYTDVEVLSEPLTDLVENASMGEEKYEVQFCIPRQRDMFGGDITSSNGITPDNIEGLIGKLFIDPFLAQNPFIYPRDIREIIHIVDLDGAFIPSESVVSLKNGNGKDRIRYTEDFIETEDVTAIVDRNKRKSNNIRRLIEMNEIVIRPKNGRNTKKVNYSVYYFSCNMDHVMHKKLNLSPQEKVQMADDYSVTYSYSPDIFVKTINDGAKKVSNMNYQESWNYVMNGTESLKRHTNLNLLIDRFLKETV